MLDAQQEARAIEALQEYVDAPPDAEGLTPKTRDGQLDANRRALIDQTLKPLVEQYLSGGLPLEQFKTQVDGLNKRNEYWGFKGIKGQMFFNQVVNVAMDRNETDQELR